MTRSRRALLRDLGLALGACAAPAALQGCAAARAQLRPPDAPVHLGWRWLPGDALRFATRLALVRPDGWTLHTALWRYVATELRQDGTITLLATQQGVDAQRGRGPLPPRALPPRVEPLANVPVRFAVDGRMPLPDGDTLDDRLAHLMLGMALPPYGVRPGDAWPDPGLLVPFLSLLPPSLPVTSQSRTTLESLEPAVGSWRAKLAHSARLRTVPGGPTLLLRGSTLWQAEPGLVIDRWVEVRMSPDAATGDPAVGTLRAELWHTP